MLLYKIKFNKKTAKKEGKSIKRNIQIFIKITLILIIFLLMSILGYSGDSYDFILKWGSHGSGDGQFDIPFDVSIDLFRNVYVTDMYNHRIQKFAPSIDHYIFDSHDFIGNGTSDISVFRSSDGYWYIKDLGAYQWGIDGDIPVPGDYNGDGISDIAVWRPLNGIWHVKGISFVQWGTSGDIPLIR